MYKKIIFLFLFLWASNSFAQNVLTVNQAIEAVLKNNYDIIIQKNKSEILKTNSEASVANFLPKAGISISKSGSINSIEQKFSNGTETTKDGVTGSNFNPQLNITWTLFDGMKMFAVKSRLKNLSIIGELNYKDSLQTLIAQTIIAYYDIVSANMQLKALNDAIKISEERVTLTEKQYLVGASSKVDWLQARVDLNEEKSLVVNQLNLIEQKKADLNRLMALTPETYFTTVDSISFSDHISLSTLNELENQNFQLLMAEKNRQNSYLSKKVIFSNYLPQLNVMGNYGLSRSKNSAGFSLLNQTNGFSGGVSLYMPIFAGTLTQKQVKVANINTLNAEMMYQKIHLQTNVKYFKAQKDFEKAKLILKMEEENILLANENLKIAAERFRLAESTAIEMRQAETSYSNAMNRLVQAKFTLKSAETELLRMMGKLVN
jgi:outer membrane protein TolC